MKKALTVLALLVGVAFICPSRASAQTQTSNDRPDAHSPEAPKVDADQPDFDRLNRRIDELERQNRTMMQLLVELKNRLDSPARPANANVTPPAAEGVRRPGNVNQPDKLAATPQPVGEESLKVAPAAVSEPRPGGADQTVGQSNKPPEPVGWSQLIGEGNRIKFYGFLRLDIHTDSHRPNNVQSPFFITSEDPRLGKPGAGGFSMHPRLTRFGVDYSGPQIGSLADARLSGKLELDFNNGGSESRQIIRIRHAFFKMGWSDFAILGGQTNDMFSPLFPTVNNDTLMWTAGNLGDRRPQFRLAYEPKVAHGQWSIVGGIGLTGAIDLQDLDANGFRDGEESGRPDVQARIGYSQALWVKDQPAIIGASGYYGWLNTSRAVTAATRNSFRSQVVNIDYTLPLANRLSLRGEGWWGRNMSDTRGGAGQGINLATGREIRGRGGWSELSVKLSRYYSFHPGFTTDDPVDGDVAVGGRTRNRAFYLGNRVTPGGNFLIGADYLRWKTDFKGFLPGVDNRLNIFFQYNY